MGNVRLVRLWCCVIGLAGPGTVAAVEPITDKELYDEGYDPIISSEPQTEGSEEAVMLPSWPSEQDLLTVNLSLVDFPYTLLIDEKSLAVGKDRVIRYTAILRSAGGVDNIAYEGISCNSRQVRRYAYGSRGQFRPVRKPEWRFVLRKGQDRYRHELIESYFCPLPSGDMEHEILGKLKSRNPYR